VETLPDLVADSQKKKPSLFARLTQTIRIRLNK